MKSFKYIFVALALWSPPLLASAHTDGDECDQAALPHNLAEVIGIGETCIEKRQEGIINPVDFYLNDLETCRCLQQAEKTSALFYVQKNYPPAIEARREYISIQRDFERIENQTNTMINAFMVNAWVYANDDDAANDALTYSIIRPENLNRTVTEKKNNLLKELERMGDDRYQPDQARQLRTEITNFNPKPIKLVDFQGPVGNSCVSQQIYETFKLLPTENAFYTFARSLKGFNQEDWSFTTLIKREDAFINPDIRSRIQFLNANPIIKQLFSMKTTDPKEAELLSTSRERIIRAIKQLGVTNCQGTAFDCWHDVMRDNGAQRFNNFRNELSQIVQDENIKDLLNTHATQRLSREYSSSEGSPTGLENLTEFRNPQNYMWHLSRMRSPLLTRCVGNAASHSRCRDELIELCPIMLKTEMPPELLTRNPRETIGDLLARMDSTPLRPEGFKEFEEKICHTPYNIAGKQMTFDQFKDSHCANGKNATVCSDHRAILAEYLNKVDGGEEDRLFEGLSRMIGRLKTGQTSEEAYQTVASYSGTWSEMKRQSGGVPYISRQGNIVTQESYRAESISAQTTPVQETAQSTTPATSAQGNLAQNTFASAAIPATASFSSPLPAPTSEESSKGEAPSVSRQTAQRTSSEDSSPRKEVTSTESAEQTRRGEDLASLERQIAGLSNSLKESDSLRRDLQERIARMGNTPPKEEVAAASEAETRVARRASDESDEDFSEEANYRGPASMAETNYGNTSISNSGGSTSGAGTGPVSSASAPLPDSALPKLTPEIVQQLNRLEIIPRDIADKSGSEIMEVPVSENDFRLILAGEGSVIRNYLNTENLSQGEVLSLRVRIQNGDPQVMTQVMAIRTASGLQLFRPGPVQRTPASTPEVDPSRPRMKREDLLRTLQSS